MRVIQEEPGPTAGSAPNIAGREAGVESMNMPMPVRASPIVIPTLRAVLAFHFITVSFSTGGGCYGCGRGPGGRPARSCGLRHRLPGRDPESRQLLTEDVAGAADLRLG